MFENHLYSVAILFCQTLYGPIRTFYFYYGIFKSWIYIALKSSFLDIVKMVSIFSIVVCRKVVPLHDTLMVTLSPGRGVRDWQRWGDWGSQSRRGCGEHQFDDQQHPWSDSTGLPSTRNHLLLHLHSAHPHPLHRLHLTIHHANVTAG